MTNFFAKENRTYSDLSTMGKRRYFAYLGLQIFLFVSGALLFWQFMYNFCNGVGAIVSGTPSQALVQWYRMAPLMLTALVFLVLGIRLSVIYTAPSVKKRAGGWRATGVFSVVGGGAVLLLVVIGVIRREYHSLVEGVPFPLFPLDMLLIGALLVAAGILMWKNGTRIREKDTVIPLGRKSCFVRKFFRGVTYTVALQGFAACLYGTYVMDWTHGNIFFNIMLWLNYFAPVALVWVYRVLYADAKEELKPRIAKWWGLGFLIADILLLALLLIATQLQNEAPNQNAFGILPVAFTASFNAFVPIYGLHNVIAPLTAFLTGIFMERKRKNG